MKAARLYPLGSSMRAGGRPRSPRGGGGSELDSMHRLSRSRELQFTRPLKSPRGTSDGNASQGLVSDDSVPIFLPSEASEADLVHAQEVLESELERSRQTFPRDEPRDDSSLNAGHIVGDEFDLNEEVSKTDRRVLRQTWQFHERVTRRRRWTTNLLLAFGVLAAVCVVTEQELIYNEFQKCSVNRGELADRAVAMAEQAWLTRTILKAVVSLASLVMPALVYVHYRTKLLELYQREQFVAARISIWRSPFFWRFVVELLVNFLHVPPGVETVIRANDYTDRGYPERLAAVAQAFPGNRSALDAVVQFCEVLYHIDVLNLFVCLRLYHLLRFLTLYSSLNSSSSKFIRQFTTVKPQPSLVVKYLVDRMPLRFLLISLFTLMVSMAYGLKQCEQVADIRLGSFANALWLTYISLTSVGYGDFYPSTLCGRSVQIFNVSAGLIFSSLVIAVVARQLRYHDREASYIRVINRDSVNRQTRNAAAIVIQRFWRFHLAAKAASVRTGPPRYADEPASATQRMASVATLAAGGGRSRTPSLGASAQPQRVSPGPAAQRLIQSFIKLYDGKRRWKDVQRTARDERFFDPSTEETILQMDLKQDHVEDYIEQLEHYINVRFELQKRSLQRIENALLQLAAQGGVLPKDAEELPSPRLPVRPSVASELLQRRQASLSLIVDDHGDGDGDHSSSSSSVSLSPRKHSHKKGGSKAKPDGSSKPGKGKGSRRKKAASKASV